MKAWTVLVSYFADILWSPQKLKGQPLAVWDIRYSCIEHFIRKCEVWFSFWLVGSRLFTENRKKIENRNCRFSQCELVQSNSRYDHTRSRLESLCFQFAHIDPKVRFTKQSTHHFLPPWNWSMNNMNFNQQFPKRKRGVSTWTSRNRINLIRFIQPGRLKRRFGEY